MRSKIALTALAAASLNLAFCILDEDVDDFSFALPDKTFQVDVSELGISTETSIACQSTADICPSLSSALVCTGPDGVCAMSDSSVFPEISCEQQDICADFGGAFACESTSHTCMARAEVQLSALVHLSEEVPELQEVGSVSFAKVTIESLFIDVEVNTLGIDTQPMDLYLAPESLTSIFDNGGNLRENVTRIGTVPTIQPGTGRVDIALTAEGRTGLTEQLRDPTVPFKFFVYGVMEFFPGDDLPNLVDGQLRIIVSGEAVASTSL